MSFITDSVGQQGKNNPSDVRVIQWMLKRAHLFYGQNLFSSLQTVSETGSLNNVTLQMIADITARKANQTEIFQPAPLGQKSISGNSFEFFNRPLIFPDDGNYKYLLKCSLKPICVVCSPEGDIKIDFNTDPLVIEALGSRMNFQSFKTQAEAKDILECVGGNNLSCDAPIESLINAKVSLIGFTKTQEERIKKCLIDLTFSGCADAFRRAKLPTPEEVLRRDGIAFIHFDALNSPLREDLRKLGFNEQLRSNLRIKLLNSQLSAGAYTADPNETRANKMPTITFFYEHSFNWKEYSFEESMAHEAIHRSGVTPYFRFSGHDLSNYSNYYDIIKSCTLKEPK
jgi:hypothetical protein